MLQRIHYMRVWGAALATIAMSSGSASAQGSADVSADSKAAPDEAKDEAKKASAPRRSSEESRRQNEPRDRRTGDATKSAHGGSASAGRVNEAFSFLVGSGCQFSSTIRGTIRSAQTAPGDEPKYVPNLVVNAWVTCQNNTEQRVVDNTVREMPMTRSELEQAIELRGSLLDEGSGRRCAYVPDFALSENKIAGFGVAYMCPVKLGGSGDNHAALEGSRPAAGEPRGASRGKPGPDTPSSEHRGSAENRAAGENKGSSDNKGTGDRKGTPGSDEPNLPDEYE
jgi:hypothetical protein